MAYSTRVREELCRADCQTAADALWELYGAYLACGARISTRHACVARRLLSLCRRHPDLLGEAALTLPTTTGGFYRLTVPRPPAFAGDPLDYPKAQALLRGAFLCRGSVSDPKSESQLSLRLPGKAAAQPVLQALSLLSCQPGERQETAGYRLYLKSAESIGELLGRIGAQNSYLTLLSLRVVREMRANVNRQVNCDNANISRQQAASESLCRHIALLRKNRQLDALPQALREMAALREQYPHASIEELGRMAQPPLSKVTASARLQRLRKIPLIPQ